MQTGTLTLVRGDNQEISVTVLESDGSPYDLAGCSIVLTVRRSDYFSEVISPFPVTTTEHSDPESGVTKITLVPEDTAGMDANPYYFDIKLINAAEKVTTLIAGELRIVPH